MHRFLSISLIAASWFGLAVPAHADTSGTLDQLRVEREARAGKAACARSFAETQCIYYQNRLVRAVTIQTAASRQQISVNDLATRQVDALIASFN